MNEQTINGKRVTFRDKIPAIHGWKLLGPMNKLTQALSNRRDEILAKIKEPLPDGAAVIPGDEVVEILYTSLSWADVVALVRGAVDSWEFEGDLSKDTCCDDLDTLEELFPIVSQARAIYFGANLRGEADGGPTST